MASKISAGLLMYRRRKGQIEFFLVHPGGPFYARRDDGAWTIPKGEPAEGEELFDAARREFHEETGIRVPDAGTISLGMITQKGGKTVHAWAVEGDWDEVSGLRSNTFEIEWPPRSGKKQSFPEVDRAGWFAFEDARIKINPAQVELLERLVQCCGTD